MSARVEFGDGTTLDLTEVATDVTLPPWLADRADDLVHILTAIRDAVAAARELDAHRARILGDLPDIRFGGGGYANLAGPLGGGGGGAAGSDAQHQVPVPPTSDEVVEITVHLDGPDNPESPAADLSVLRCERCGQEFANKRSRGQHRRHCPAAAAPASRVPSADVLGLIYRTCRVCGCTDEDCSGCVARTGEPCSWVEVDLCSACAAPQPEPEPASEKRPSEPENIPGNMPAAAVCRCGHTPRRHEDRDGICLIGNCACTGFEVAA